MDLTEILTAQGWKAERNSDSASFYNHAPWVAPLAYLHILFKPAPKLALEENIQVLRMPESWASFLAVQNGAILFSNALSIDGVVLEGTLVNRRDPFATQPYSLVDSNRSWDRKDRESGLVIGSYGYDGTLAVLDRADGSVFAVDRKSHRVLKIWSGANEWLTDELDRIAKLYDPKGKLTVDMRETLPV